MAVFTNQDLVLVIFNASALAVVPFISEHIHCIRVGLFHLFYKNTIISLDVLMNERTWL